MVFESIVVDVLNRFLGDYVENLNRSQLKLGIWGGDVVLENLKLKQNALEELNIPVQTVYGHLGKLVLKIPWKNLYGASVEASIERLFLIVNPSAEVVYDPEKEEKLALAAKQAELVRVEEAKKKEAEKDQNKLDETFVEKLVTQIIKNVQLNIKDIHIRYEDSITNPKAPFSFGITLHNLSVHTTDENWKQTVIQDAVTKIFKILNLDGLAIYWNPATELYAKHAEDSIRERLEKEIATKSSQPTFYKYALGPINATAKLKLNPKPEADTPKFSLPKVILTLHMEQLSVNLNKKQYQDMMLLADSMDRMNKGAPYRKYRPNLRSYRGHYKEWWNFAYKCILEDEVRRRRRNWDWTHMLTHRNLCKDYAKAYQCKLSNKGKATQEQQCLLDEAEKKLDLLNLVVIRQRIEMEVERLGKLEEEARKSRGWFSGWWGGANNQDSLAEGTAIMKQFQNAMTPEEKAKLFRAIDYQENSAPLHLPTEYVAVEMCFRLDRCQVAVNDDKEVLKACVDNVVVEMGQRPSANAIRVDVQMQAFTVTGVQQGEYTPQLVTSKEVTSDVNLLNVTFETKPLDGKCDQRVRVSARPLQIIYDAQTVIEIVNVFKPETESSALTTLQAVAENKMADLKEKSALGMQYAVHQHTFIDLDIDIAASYIVVSQTGKFKPEEPCIVVKLGAISIKSEPRDSTLDVHRLYKEGLADDQIIQEIARHSYDQLHLQLTEMQIVIALRNEDWQSVIASHEATPLHLLQPTNLVIQIHKCLITDDPRLPKVRIKGELQKIAISASEDRLLTLCEILIGMPLPKAEESTQLKASESKGSSLSLLTKYLDPVEKQKRDTARAKRKSDEQSVQLTEVEAVFIMNELVLSVNRKKPASGKSYDKFLVFSLYMLELTATQKTFMLEATVRLGAVGMQHHRQGMDMIQMIDTPEVFEIEDNEVKTSEGAQSHSLFAVTYSNVDKKCPEFRSHYGSVEQMIELDFATLRVLLHLEGLQEILVIVNEYQTRLQNLQSTVDRVANAGPLETIVEDEELCLQSNRKPALQSRHGKSKSTIQLKVDVKIGAVEIEFATDNRRLSLVQLQKAAAGLILKSSYTQVDCAISDINVQDLNPATIHKDILKVLGGDVMNVQVVMYNLEPGSNNVNDVNMSVDAQINCLRIVFLNWFVNSMLEFLNNFQTAQQAIIEASSQAVESARANVQNAYENSTKLALKVRLAAPIIVVPENSKSKKALLVDLGRMTLANKFVDLKVPNVNNRVTVDELTLELEDIRLSCVSLVDDMTAVKDERKLLKPTSLKLFVKRSLSTWYEDLPELDLSGRLKTISIRVGHSDYKSIMKILNQNLQEGQKSDVKSQASLPKATSKAAVRSTSKQDTRRTTVASIEAKDVDVKKPRTTIKFAFTMDSFVIDLVNNNTHAAPGIDSDIELARFCLALFSVKGRMFSDGSINTSLLLVDCTLDDTRPDRGEKLTRYLERRRASGDNMMSEETVNEPLMEAPDKIRSMIDITYTMKNQDTYIDIRVFSFNLILAMDFLNKIADFMKVGLEEEVPDDDSEEGEDKSPHVVNKLDKAPDVSQSVVKKKPTVVAQPAESQPKKLAMMTINIKIQQPDIILVESLETRTCDALVLNMEARFKLRKNEERMVADGGISGLQMVIRTLGKVEKNQRYLLEPANMSFALSQPPNCGMHVDVAISNIKITVSPDIIALLNRVMATMTSSEEANTQQADRIIVYSHLWDIAPFKPNAYWFLKTEIAEEAMDIDEPPELTVKEKVPTDEICMLSSPSIVLSLEMQIGTETIPVLVMQASLTGQVKDWSSDFYLESTWAMQVSYYNLSRAVWEPLIEPVEVLKDYSYKHVPWELKMEVVMRPALEQSVIDLTDEAANVALIAHRQANKTVTISSQETLEITVTRSGVEVLTLLGNSFSAAIADTADQSGSVLARLHEENNTKSEYYGAPYVLHNCTGLTAKLLLEDNHDFTVFLADGKKQSDYREVVFETGASVPLKLKRGGLHVMKLNEPPPPLSLSVKIVELEEQVQVPVERADKRYFPLGRQQPGSIDRTAPHVFLHESRGLISDVVMQEAALHIYLRSVVQVTNNLSVSVSVYYMTLSGNEVRLLGEVKSGATLRLPLQAVHTPTAEIFFSVEGFTVSVSPFIWRELQQEVRIAKLLQCDSKDKTSGEKFYLNAIGTMEQVFLENTNRHTFASSCYDIVLKPAVKMQNCLPVDIVVSQLGLNRTQIFKPGEMFHLSHLAPNKASIVVMIQNYLDKCWVCTKNLPDNETELSVWSFESHDSPAVMTLDLGMHSVESEGSQVLSLYCPFWMLNKTGLTLCYRKSKKADKDSSTPNKNVDETGNVIFHPKEYKEPILFSFRAKNFFGKKKAAIRIDFGEWSEKFSLDVPGSSGVITCKHEGRSYQVAVTNQLSFNSLTKMVIFTPFFLIINEAAFGIEYQELHRSADPWKEVERNSSAPLWPVVEKEEKLLILRVAGTKDITAPFLYTEQHGSCLKLNNEFGGLHVEVQLSEGGTYITVRQYRDGHAPALLINYCPYTVTVYEKENVNSKKIGSMQKMLYTWDNPAGPRVLIFAGHNKKEIENDLRQDGIGEFMIDSQRSVWWVSFLDGLQRIVLFTDDAMLASGAHTVGEAEIVDMEIIFAIHGVGLSLVNDPEHLELIYMTISNSGIIWEQCKLGARRYKKIEGTKLRHFEEAYQRYLLDKASSEPEIAVCHVDEKTEVNFDEMRVIKPNPRLLRRTLEPGLWASIGMTTHSRRLHARLHRLQIDQQLPLPTFPVTLAPVPPPPSVATQDNIGIKPFIEVSIVERIMEHSKVRQYKYYKVLIQEFHVKVDMGLVNALLGMFPQRLLTEQEALEAFITDLENARQPLEALAAIGAASDIKNFYDNLHLSPLKVHVSFSLGGATQLPSFIGTVLQSIGVTLTDMNDVVFKLSYYERNFEFLSQKELISQVSSHYQGQAIKQLYVLVLGLDVIGNPYGLVVGLKKGVEDLFYEPFQGAIQGPGEFAEGLFLGVRSLVGHTVGGAAGAMSRITGAMGHGLAALSLDKDYQRRRRDNINKPPANLQEGLARSGKGLVMGLFDGVTGVFTKPIEGARSEGVEGFFKGLGRGAVGLVARPTAGVVDFASGSFDAVKRAADLSEETTKRRAARYLPADTGVRPYSRSHAEGYKMLFELEKGKYVSTDSYEAHVWVIPSKEVVMCTDKRLLYLEKNVVFGGWQILWTYLWTELPEVPTAVAKGVYIPTNKKKVLGMFPSSGSGKVIFLVDEKQKKYLLAQCERLMRSR
ncbi:LOW QUALITY PROTEIN: vacuolar protein sorting-associated protein 13-like [Leguminivora glycinivorella]|uniref:LOW QUALITY PROTEIN: vacuolar protein sorting-associated protein 13-like n=1 Tax=Leguminivora glycinivorella TaxID=1035111 RepID=UPI00200F703B|nr:LOW QUALITY PROTEIN: vacuolar protein sorting-associated protein 13-like [Leguminivora glycinivorella]